MNAWRAAPFPSLVLFPQKNTSASSSQLSPARARLPRVDKRPEGLELLLEGHGLALEFQIVGGGAKQRDVPVRPVDLRTPVGRTRARARSGVRLRTGSLESALLPQGRDPRSEEGL